MPKNTPEVELEYVRSFLSLPVRMHGGLICIAFRLSVRI